MKVVWTRRAATSLDLIYDHIAQDDPGAARRLATRIIDSIQRLAEQPNIGRPGRVVGTRELVVPGTPCIVPYQVKDNVVQILHILHAARKWPGRFED